MNPPVKDKKTLIAILVGHKNQIRSFGVKKIGLFGSFVRDQAKKESDVDFLVEFYPEEKNFDNFIELAFYLEDLLGRKVEIITPQSLSKYIGPFILKEVEYVPFAA